jgi:large subunit ribosomal protein L19
MNIIQKIEKEQMKESFAPFNVGDQVKVHTRVVEGGKERIQIFAGIVLAKKGSGLGQSFTVRKISYGEGVERVFPVHSPKVAKIEVTQRGKVRRARLHYLRDRVGKRATTVKAASDQSGLVMSTGGRRKKRADAAAAALLVPEEGTPQMDEDIAVVADVAPDAPAATATAEAAKEE